MYSVHRIQFSTIGKITTHLWTDWINAFSNEHFQIICWDFYIIWWTTTIIFDMMTRLAELNLHFSQVTWQQLSINERVYLHTALFLNQMFTAQHAVRSYTIANIHHYHRDFTTFKALFTDFWALCWWIQQLFAHFSLHNTCKRANWKT